MAPHPAASYTKTAVALYDFQGESESELSFRAGQEIQLKENPINAEWWEAHIDGAFGMVPVAYLDEGQSPTPTGVSLPPLPPPCGL